jgi:Ni/Co efflux regulator RcnB
MGRFARTIVFGLAAALVAAFVVSSSVPVQADPPGGFKHKGKGRSGEQSHNASRDGGVSIEINFGSQDRVVAREYFGGLVQQGRCPPGLAKKNNGCMPPGQAKKWAVGQRLPRDVVFYDLPPDLLVRLSVPPQGYRYVRVAADILMIAVGTGMVAAAIEDLAG